MGVEITDLERAGESWRDGEERLRLATEAMQIGHWELDLLTGVAQRSLRHDQIFGYSELLPVWTYEILLTLRALRKNNIRNEVVVARDGNEALDYLFGTGPCAMRDAGKMPHLILLDLKLPKVSGLEVLRRLRGDERTRLLSVGILTSSNEDQDRLNSYHLGANSYIRKPVDFTKFTEAVGQLGYYWLVVNEPPPLRNGI